MSEEVRFAVNLPLPGPALRDQRELVTALPDLGYADVWTGEGSGADAFTPLAAAAAWQPRLGVGAGVVPVFTRGPGVLAQTAATLAHLVGPRPDGSPGRVLFGIGTSVPAHVSAINGFTFDRPVARLRDTLRFLTAALRGEPADGDYETFSIRNFPRWAPTGVKVLVGALRPRMVRLSLTEGDGFITNVLTPADLGKVLQEAGSRPDGKEIVVRLFVCPTEDAGHARRTGRAFLGWITNQAPYRAFQDWLGHGDAFKLSRARYDEGDRRGAEAELPDDLVDSLWIHGSPAECRRRIAEYLQEGVTSIVINVIPTPELLSGRAELTLILAGIHPRG